MAPQTVGGTSGTVNFSTDADQSCMYVADLGNNIVYMINRQNLTELGSIWRRSAARPASSTGRTWSAVDSGGNVYIGEVDGAARTQKFLRYGAAGCTGTGSAEVGRYVK